MMTKEAAITAKKSQTDGRVGISMQLKCSGWGSDSARISGSTTLTSEQARNLAQSLIALADAADKKVAAKAAEKERRRKWQEREIAAGRMVVFGGRL